MTEDVSRRTEHAGAPDWDAIARYLAGESSAEEATRVSRWLDAHPADKELIERLNASAALDAPVDVDVDAALSRAHTRMAETNVPSLTVERGNPRRSRAAMFGGIVAAAAAAFVAAISFGDRGADPAPPAADRVYSTAVGKRDSIRLADGSRVILGPDSRLTVPGDYGSRGRDVALDGDAYFDVVHDTTKPFSIRVANAVIEDVGTTFTVETDPSNTTTVSVMSGVVRLRPSTMAASSGTILSAGDRGVLTNDGRVHAQQRVVAADDSAWTAGKLVFRDVPLARVVGELRRWYGLRVGVTDSALLRRTVNTTLTAEQPVSEVVDILSLMLGLRIELQGDSATIHAGRR
jgi:transmembrane sensor